MTKTAFLAAYEAQLPKVHAWAMDPQRLENFMSAIRTYVRDNRRAWLWNSPSSQAAWRAIGCKGRISFKALCALPDGEV